uniref:Olfactomedin-like protein 2A n=1 Tax=Phallusia mammillata TaxID=59560 RepID=A0A6F9DM85_9ASCI|nr:olfactomedin-like protein 2A [Phallusia mammillata]
MTRPHLFICAFLTTLGLSLAFEAEILHNAASQIRSVSEGSDCRCSCVLNPVDHGPCPDKPNIRNIRFTIDTISGGSDCRCSCYAPTPTDTCQQTTDTSSRDDDAITGSRNGDVAESVKRATTASDLNTIRSSFQDVTRALIDLGQLLSISTSNNESIPLKSSLTKLSEQLETEEQHNQTDLNGKKDLEVIDEHQISSNETKQNQSDSSPNLNPTSEDEVETFIAEVLLEINGTEEANSNTSDALQQDSNSVVITTSFAVEDLFRTVASKEGVSENAFVATTPATIARIPDVTKATVVVTEESWTSAGSFTDATIKVEADEATELIRQEEALVRPRLVKAPQVRETVTPKPNSTQNHSQTTIIENGTTKNPSTTPKAIEPTTASITPHASVQSTEAVTFEQTYAITDSTSATTTKEMETTAVTESTQASLAAVSPRQSYVPYRDSNFDLTKENKPSDKAKVTEEYNYEYDDNEEAFDTVQSPLVEGKVVDPDEDDFDVNATQADVQIMTTMGLVSSKTPLPKSLAPTFSTTTENSTQNKTVATIPVTVTATPTATSAQKLTTMAATSTTTTISPSQSGDGDLRASYYSPMDDEGNVDSSEVELSEDEFYFDYEEETTTAPPPLSTTTPPARCGTLFNLSSPYLVHDFGRREGNWFTDPLASGPERNKIYVTNFYYGNTLIEFDSMANFKDFRWSHSHMLPYSWIGTGHIVYNGSFYYNRAFSRNIIKYNLKQRFVSAWGHLRNAVYDSTTPFTWRGHTMVHMAADESGLWVIYAAHSDFGRHANSQHYVVNKINPVDLQTIQSWRTPIRRRGISHLFIICGVVYATDRYDSRRARITHAFDTHTGVRRLLFIPFHNQFAYNVQLLYNPKEKRIYSWDKGHQMLYDISFTY